MTHKIIDLTHVMIPGEEQYSVTIHQRGALRETQTGDIMNDVTMWSHSGTHVEMPLHFYANGKDTASYAPDHFVGAAIRIDVRHKAVNEAITLDDLKAADIRTGDIVILWEGRDGQYRTPASHQRPYVAADAAEYLALEKRIKLLGTDSSGFEVRGRNDHPNHHLFFREDVAIPVVECLRNLGAISSDRFFFVGLPLPVKGMDASPIRAIAIEGMPV